MLLGAKDVDAKLVMSDARLEPAGAGTAYGSKEGVVELQVCFESRDVYERCGGEVALC